MKAILEYNLPDDQSDFNLAVKAKSMWFVLWDLDQYLRSTTKYAPDSMPEQEYKAYITVRERLNELMRDYEVSWDMVE